MELLPLKDRILNIISSGESHFIEFKSAIEGKPGSKKKRKVKKVCEDIGEALVSFANADSGEILIGVEDDGEITGVPHSPEEVEKMLQAYRTHVFGGQQIPIIQNVKVNIDGKVILYFYVNKGSTQIYQLPDGRCVRRKDKSTLPESFTKLLFDKNEIKSRQFDSEYADGAVVNDLDLELLAQFANQYITGLSIELYLQQIGLANYASNGLRLKNAALLLFSKTSNLNKWHPRCQIRYLKVNGDQVLSGVNYNVISDEVLTGNILELCVKGWESLKPYITTKTVYNHEARFYEVFSYPEEACREALINAIAHRDYSSTNGIEVYLYDTKLEIRSPGALLSNIDINRLYDMEGIHQSRNVHIAKVLRVNNFMRELGEGMRRIFQAFAKNELERPLLYSNGNWFSITFKMQYSSGTIKEAVLPPKAKTK